MYAIGKNILSSSTAKHNIVAINVITKHIIIT